MLLYRNGPFMLTGARMPDQGHGLHHHGGDDGRGAKGSEADDQGRFHDRSLARLRAWLRRAARAAMDGDDGDRCRGTESDWRAEVHESLAIKKPSGWIP